MWPGKKNKERARKDLHAARQERVRSDRLLAEARKLADEIHSMREENHFAEAIAATLKGRGASE